MGGTLVFKGTRVQAQTLFGYVDKGPSLDLFLDYFPSVNRNGALDFLRITREKNYPR